MHESKTIRTPNQFDLPLPAAAPVRKPGADAQAFIRVLDTASKSTSSTKRISRTDLTDFFINLTKGDELDYRIALRIATKRAIEGGTTRIRVVQDQNTGETCYEGVDLALLRELFPDGTVL
jgi:hypothetical protein